MRLISDRGSRLFAHFLRLVSHCHCVSIFQYFSYCPITGLFVLLHYIVFKVPRRRAFLSRPALSCDSFVSIAQVVSFVNYFFQFFCRTFFVPFSEPLRFRCFAFAVATLHILILPFPFVKYVFTILYRFFFIASACLPPRLH